MCMEATHLYTPNKFVRGLTKGHPKALFGASVHPYRRDAVQEAEHCLELDPENPYSPAVVLFKWAPSAQQIDPADDACVPFYEFLAERNVPLLCHTEAEHAIPTSDEAANRFNHPCRLLKALKLGVRVIAAHCATAFWSEAIEQDCFEDFLCMLRESEFLYGDISAFCWPQRIHYLKAHRCKQGFCRDWRRHRWNGHRQNPNGAIRARGQGRTCGTDCRKHKGYGGFCSDRA